MRPEALRLQLFSFLGHELSAVVTVPLVWRSSDVGLAALAFAFTRFEETTRERLRLAFHAFACASRSAFSAALRLALAFLILAIVALAALIRPDLDFALLLTAPPLRPRATAAAFLPSGVVISDICSTGSAIGVFFAFVIIPFYAAAV